MYSFINNTLLLLLTYVKLYLILIESILNLNIKLISSLFLYIECISIPPAPPVINLLAPPVINLLSSPVINLLAPPVID